MKMKDFSMEGSYKDDSKIIKVKEKYQLLLEEQMRSAGRVPVLSQNPIWRTSWDSEREAFNFKITMYGVYVGKRRAQVVIGYDGIEDKMYE